MEENLITFGFMNSFEVKKDFDELAKILIDKKRFQIKK